MMKLLLALMIIASSVTSSVAAPKWLYMDDDNLIETFGESKQVADVILLSTSLENIRPPFARVVHQAIVIYSYKGELWMGEKIEIEFPTDSLPMNAEKRKAFIKSANSNTQGALRTVFLYEDKSSRLRLKFKTDHKNRIPRFSASCWDLPTYSDKMHKFLKKIPKNNIRKKK